MRIAGDIFTFLTFFFLPFLGGNHLPLFYVSIDKFWIETIFGICLVISVMLRYMRSEREPTGFIGFAVCFLPFALLSAISLSYSWNRFSTLISLSILVWALGGVYLFLLSPKKELCLRRSCGRCDYEFSKRYPPTPHPISESYEDLRARHVCEPSEGAGRDTICIVFIP